MTDYVDSELYVTDRDQALLTIEGRQYHDRPQLDEECEQSLLAQILDPKGYGSKIFSSALVGNLLSGYRSALDLAQRRGARLRLRLHVADTAPAMLHALRWELLYDPHRSVALGGSQEIAFSRYLSLPESTPAPVKERPRLLVVLADPSDLAERGLAPMDRETTLRALEKTLKPLERQMSWEVLEGRATAARLRDRLVAGGIHALHLQAHGLLGSTAAGLVLEKEDGKADLVDEERLARVFEGARTLRLVTLVACHGGRQTRDDPFSGLGPGLVRRGIPAVVAMRKEISFAAAARFCEHFYLNLARTGYVDAAVNEARNQLFLSRLDESEFGTPILYMRLADGLLWEVRRPEPVHAPVDTEIDWGELVATLQTDNLVPFLGPGLWRGLLPSRSEIAARWVAEYSGEFPVDVRTELPAVAQVLDTSKVGAASRDRMLRLLAADLIRKQDQPERERLRDLTLSEVIDHIADRHFDSHPDDSHRILAELRISTYVTTNPDSFLTAALRWAKKRPIREHCPWRRPPDNRAALRRYAALRGTRDEPLVFHLYGSDEAPTSLVLTEDDHLDFLRALAHGDAELPEAVNRKLAESTLLFLGYDVRRLDCRVLLRGLIDQLKTTTRDRIAVLQVDPEAEEHGEELAAYMAKCCKKLLINVYSGSVQDFLVTLRERWMQR